MGKGFGNLGVHMRHIITYSLSPHEQRLFAGYFSRGIPNTIRRFNEEIVYIAPGFIYAALVYYFGKRYDRMVQRKNPADYEDEE